jgi:hypothetical protein
MCRSWQGLGLLSHPHDQLRFSVSEATNQRCLWRQGDRRSAAITRNRRPRAWSLWRTCLGRCVTKIPHEGGRRVLKETGRSFRPRLTEVYVGLIGRAARVATRLRSSLRSAAIDVAERLAPRSVPSILLRQYQGGGAGDPINLVLRHPLDRAESLAAGVGPPEFLGLERSA